MSHSLRITPAFERYCDKFQPGFLTGDVTDWNERARSRAVELKQKAGGLNAARFWAVIPETFTAREETNCAARMLMYLEQEVDFDKALARFLEWMKEKGM